MTPENAIGRSQEGERPSGAIGQALCWEEGELLYGANERPVHWLLTGTLGEKEEGEGP